MSLISITDVAFGCLENRSTVAAATSHSHSPQRILVVEDDMTIRLLYAKTLARAGYQVDTAEDGEAGWTALCAMRRVADSYDLMITDNNMPKLSGVELIEMVFSAGMLLPIIMASGLPSKDLDSLAFVALLPKPFSPAELLQKVKDVLLAVRAHRESPEAETHHRPPPGMGNVKEHARWLDGD